jgi:hypothetical protein
VFFSCDEQCAALMLTKTEQLVSKTSAFRFNQAVKVFFLLLPV